MIACRSALEIMRIAHVVKAVAETALEEELRQFVEQFFEAQAVERRRIHFVYFVNGIDLIQRLLVSVPLHRVVAVQLLRRRLFRSVAEKPRSSERLILSIACSPSRIISAAAARKPAGLSRLRAESLGLVEQALNAFQPCSTDASADSVSENFKIAAHFKPLDHLLEIRRRDNTGGRSSAPPGGSDRARWFRRPSARLHIPARSFR